MSGTSGKWIGTLEKELEKVEADNKDLKHDIERQTQVNTDLLAENERLREQITWAVNHYGMVRTDGIFKFLREVLK